jgi:GNAT superfamily N-acetyltransferase
MSFYYPTEADRSWLEEALNPEFFTPDDVIFVPDETKVVFRVSVIDSQRRCWFMHDVTPISGQVITVGMSTHPSLRGQGIGTVVFREHALWLKQQPWNLTHYISTVPANVSGTLEASYGSYWKKLDTTINIHTKPGEDPNPAYDYIAYKALLSDIV